jgi:hypothetical protein
VNRRQQRQRRGKDPEPCGFVAFCSFNGSDSDLDPFLANNAKSAKELGRFSMLFHLRSSATSAVENPELPRHGNYLFKQAQ